jgi:hypothetical protein
MGKGLGLSVKPHKVLEFRVQWFRDQGFRGLGFSV